MRAYRAFLPENKMRTEPQNTLQNRALRRSKKVDESTIYMMCDLPLVPGSNPGGPTKHLMNPRQITKKLCIRCARTKAQRSPPWEHLDGQLQDCATSRFPQLRVYKSQGTKSLADDSLSSMRI